MWGPGEGDRACLVLLSQPLLQPLAPRGPQSPQALPRPCQGTPGAPHLVRRPLIPGTLLGKGPTSQDRAPGWFLLWVRGQVGDLVFRLRAPRLSPHLIVKVPLRAWCSAVDAGKTTQTGSYSDENCALRGSHALGQSTQSSYVKMVVCDEYYGVIPVTGVW